MDIRAITFDTGGTILDWHSSLFNAFKRVGNRVNISRDWHALTNAYRRQAMKGIVGQVQPAFNMDDVHRTALDEVLVSHGLEVFSQQNRWEIFNAWRELSAWPDFPSALVRLKEEFPVISFTMLPLSMVLEVSRRNDLNWDAVISCEMIGVYKPHPEAYLKVAKWLGLEPSQILIVACHNFDLNAARSCGFKTAFIRRPDEWGPESPPDPVAHKDCDFIEDGFDGLIRSLRVPQNRAR